ncbi:MAG: SufB/SufD family protein [Acidimicrobiales bacterium]
MTNELALDTEHPLPTAEAEAWRYSPIADLDLARFAPAAAPGGGLPVERPAEAAALVALVDGHVAGIDLDDGWAAKGVTIAAVPASEAGELLPVPEPTAFDDLHARQLSAVVVIDVPRGVELSEPILVTERLSGGSTLAASHLVVRAGDGAGVSVVATQTAAPGSDGAAIYLPRCELVAGPAARLRYAVVQELGEETWMLGRQLGAADAQATVSATFAAFGGRYARQRVDTDLIGRGATGELAAVSYGDGSQVIDFRTFQHHRARDTYSDLLFKGAVDDTSGSIYTGLIKIHPDGAGSNAHQTNRNIKLSDDAWAWSVPNLEIEHNDVRCSHASTVSPVDEDQQFYLQGRGVPPAVADRLIVGGFFAEALARFDLASVRDEVAAQVAAKLEGRGA